VQVTAPRRVQRALPERRRVGGDGTIAP
jgi:hypothetical protein